MTILEKNLTERTIKNKEETSFGFFSITFLSSGVVDHYVVVIDMDLVYLTCCLWFVYVDDVDFHIFTSFSVLFLLLRQ